MKNEIKTSLGLEQNKWSRRTLTPCIISFFAKEAWQKLVCLFKKPAYMCVSINLIKARKYANEASMTPTGARIL